MGDCDFCIYYSFPYSGIRTRVISGVGGTQNDIGPLDGFLLIMIRGC